MHRLSWLPLAFLAILQLSGCRKNLSPARFEFSFTFNGVTYSNPDFGFVSFTFGELTEIEIRKPDLFGGLIRIYWTPNCGFLEPTGMTDYASSNQVSFNYNTCTYMTFGVIDTSRIFWLSSGSKDFSLSNCKHKRVPAFPVGMSMTSVRPRDLFHSCSLIMLALLRTFQELSGFQV